MSTTPALFETMRVRNGRLPFLTRHLTRLADSTQLVGLAPPPTSLGDEALARAARTGDRVLRLTWDGVAVEWSERDLPGEGPLRVVTVADSHPGYPVKSVAREPLERALARAETQGGDEALLLTRDGRVAETARSAIVWLDGRTLRVPDLALGILPSVGLGRLVEIADARGLAITAGRYPRSALDGRAVALVNAVRGVVAVSTLDGVQVPVAPVFTDLAAGFWPSP